MSLKLLYRARYLMVLICGEDHPEVALIDSNISLILHALGEYELSLRFIEHALKLNLKYFGDEDGMQGHYWKRWPTLHPRLIAHVPARRELPEASGRAAEQGIS